MRRTLVIPLLLLVCGCDIPTDEQIALRERQELIDKCQSYGFKYKSDDFKKCMMHLGVAREMRPDPVLRGPTSCTSYNNGYGVSQTFCN